VILIDVINDLLSYIDNNEFYRDLITYRDTIDETKTDFVSIINHWKGVDNIFRNYIVIDTKIDSEKQLITKWCNYNWNKNSFKDIT